MSCEVRKVPGITPSRIFWISCKYPEVLDILSDASKYPWGAPLHVVSYSIILKAFTGSVFYVFKSCI